MSMLINEESKSLETKQMENNKRYELIFELSGEGKTGCFFPKNSAGDKVSQALPTHLKRETKLGLPSVSEPELVRHYTRLSQQNFSIDTHFYPLGSCTMKYNPRFNEKVAMRQELANLHPLQPVDTIQHMLAILYEMEGMLCEITGMKRYTFQPAAGAHGEYLGLQMIMAYHKKEGDLKRKKVIVPDSSHGTNPATATLCGCEVIEIPSNEFGLVDIDALEAVLGEDTACLMLTNPNTLGLFERDIQKIQQMVHQAGGFLYYDGANMNALFDIVRPGDMGFDVMHLNLHKSFSTPHGGGGPGAGPVGVCEKLVPFLPLPTIDKTEDESYFFNYQHSDSIGKIKAFYGNIGVVIRAYTFIKSHGLEGLKSVSQNAIINANYLKSQLDQTFPLPYPGHCMHEFVLTSQKEGWQNIHASDVGKRLLDYGVHAPTVAFPLVVPDALMIEPTESESKSTLDTFIQAMKRIAEEIDADPENFKKAPFHLPVKRCDEVQAARSPNLKYEGSF